MVIPALLSASPVIKNSMKDIEDIQKVESRIYRFLLGLAKYSTSSLVRGEIRASLFITRVNEA